MTRRDAYMNIRVKLTPEETKARIVDVAEEHFRRVGYAKTAVADLAEALGMSSANIYRFFPSKSAINNAICHKLLAEGEALAKSIVHGPGNASERMTQLVTEIHAYNKSRLTDAHRIHDMFEIAMAEHWPAIDQHCENIGMMIGQLIGEGIASGEFAEIDVAETTKTIFSCCCALFHPTMIAQCADEDQHKAAVNMAKFILRALTNGAPSSIED